MNINCAQLKNALRNGNIFLRHLETRTFTYWHENSQRVYRMKPIKQNLIGLYCICLMSGFTKGLML